MTQRAVIAEFELDPNDLGLLVIAARLELAAARENEPGCLRFDVLVFDEKEGTGAVVAVFADQAAFDLHREYPHVKSFFDAIKDIDVNWTVHRGNALT